MSDFTFITEEPKNQHDVGWVCPTCHLERGRDRHDPCLGELPGVKYACCGHGGKGNCQGYLYFDNGVRLAVMVHQVDYDDDRKKLFLRPR